MGAATKMKTWDVEAPSIPPIEKLSTEHIDALLSWIESKTTRKQLSYLLQNIGTNVSLQTFQNEMWLKSDKVIWNLIELSSSVWYTLTYIHWVSLKLEKKEESVKPVLAVVATVVQASVTLTPDNSSTDDFLSYDIHQIPTVEGITWSNVDNNIVNGVGLSDEQMQVYLYVLSKFPGKVSLWKIKEFYWESRANSIKDTIKSINTALWNQNFRAHIQFQNNEASIPNFNDPSALKYTIKWFEFEVSTAWRYIKCGWVILEISKDNIFLQLSKLLVNGWFIFEKNTWGRWPWTQFMAEVNTLLHVHKIGLSVRRLEHQSRRQAWWNFQESGTIYELHA